MVRYTIEHDQIRAHGYVDKLGVPYPNIAIETIQENMNSMKHFPFTRCCFSIGDWGIISALPALLKKKYPNLQFYIPSADWIRSTFPDSSGWTYLNSDPANNCDLVFKNNPYVKTFEKGQFDSVFCDHERCYRWDNEPLIEQIMRMFGFTEDEISTMDTRPDIYFSDQEILEGQKIINSYAQNGLNHDGLYGCILFASRIEKINNCWDKNDKSIQNLIKTIKQKRFNKDYPIFYYSSFPIEETYWTDVFDINPETFINFADIPNCNMRVQWYIKSQAKFNISYQSGFNDTITRYSDHYVATHRIGTGETTMKGVTYFQNDGSIIKYE